jgi:NADH dehydrogenase FAD-containing subunit
MLQPRKSFWTGKLIQTSPRNTPRIQQRFISLSQLDSDKNGRERVVVLGSGWAGYSFARGLDKKKYQVVVVSPRSYFVFTPLLASTSVGTLEFRTALEPVRSRRTKAEFFQAWADSVNFSSKTLSIEEAVQDPYQGRSLVTDRHADASPDQRQQEKSIETKKGQLFDVKWDKLVITVGCYNQTFNTKGVKENAFFLKDVGDARRIRNRLLSCFETAALPTTSDEMRKQLLNFAVVGGGPTGIEFSAEMHDLINEDMKRLYPDLVKFAHITVYDVASTVLGMFDEKLAKYAMNHFKREGIDIKTSHHVEELRPGVPTILQNQDSVKGLENACYTLKLKEEGEVGVGMCVWSTGLMMNPFVQKALHGKVKQHSKSGGILTNERLQVKADNDGIVSGVYALGDCAVLEGSTYPATAQVASQKAGWLAKRFNKGDIEQKAFSYKDLGIMAYVGNWNAIVQSQGSDISGRVAWFIWRGAYLAKSVSWRNRILIPVYW